MRRKMSVVIAFILAMTMTLGLAACKDKPAPTPTYTVTVENGTGGGTFEKGKEATVTATIPEGKEFVSWKSGDTVVSTHNPYTFTVTENVTLTATFKDKAAEKFTVTVENGTGGGAFDKGSSATVTATVPQHKEFVAWMSGEETVSTENPYTFTVNGNITLTATFKDKQLEDLEDVEYFTVVVDGGIIVDSDTNQFKKDSDITVRAVVPEFYDFEYWTANGEKFTEQSQFNHKVTANIKFMSVISAVSRYTLTLEGCTSESRYENGVETVTLTANTIENYKFVNWTINGETVEKPAAFEMELTENTTVTANFKRINIAITAASSDERLAVTLSSGAETEPATYEEGDSITVSAAVRNGIQVVRWTDADGNTVSTKNPYTFPASENISLTAVYSTIYTIAVTGGTLVGTEGLTEDIYGEGGNCAVEATLAENQVFVNWKDNEDNVVSAANPYLFTVIGSVALTATVKEVTAKTYVFEAENADLSNVVNNNGGAGNVEKHIDDDHGDPILNATNKCSNGWIASCFNHVVGNTITWRVHSDRAATATYVIRMGNGSWVSPNETKEIPLSSDVLSFIANDNVIDYAPFVLEGRIALPGASELSVYGFAADFVIGEIELKEGWNEIQMTLLKADYGPNIDALKLITEASLTWTPTTYGGAPVADYGYNI